jgi:hypothetical protein
MPRMMLRRTGNRLMLSPDQHRKSEIAQGSTKKDVVITLTIELYGKFITE